MNETCCVDDCPNPIRFDFRWEWGEEGGCCNEHRAILQTRSGQLGRSISFAEVLRRSYSPPQLERLEPEVGALKMRVAELQHANQMLEAQLDEKADRITALEKELETLRDVERARAGL